MTHRNDLVPSDWVAITPSDTAGVNYVGIYVGATGNVAVKGKSGTAVTFVGVPTGATLIGDFVAVMSTNTTATSLVGAVP